HCGGADLRQPRRRGLPRRDDVGAHAFAGARPKPRRNARFRTPRPPGARPKFVAHAKPRALQEEAPQARVERAAIWRNHSPQPPPASGRGRAAIQGGIPTLLSRHIRGRAVSRCANAAGPRACPPSERTRSERIHICGAGSPAPHTIVVPVRRSSSRKRFTRSAWGSSGSVIERPLTTASERTDGTFSRADFAYDSIR